MFDTNSLHNILNRYVDNPDSIVAAIMKNSIYVGKKVFVTTEKHKKRVIVAGIVTSERFDKRRERYYASVEGTYEDGSYYQGTFDPTIALGKSIFNTEQEAINAINFEVK